MIDLSLPWTIGAAIVCGGLVLPVFALLRRLPPALHESGRRLLISFALAMAIWLGAVIAGGVAGLAVRRIDIAAGVGILLSAAICAFLVIGLLAWGFTISIARDLDRVGKPVSLSEWKAAFANNTGFDAFVNDRLGLVTAMRVARLDRDKLHLTGRGRLIARLARIAMAYFAVTRA